MSLFGRQDDPGRPRTEEERERARAEREARRAAREGRRYEPPAPPPEEPAFEEEPHFAGEPSFEEPRFEPEESPVVEEPRFELEESPVVEEPRFEPKESPVVEEPRFEPEASPVVEEPRYEPEDPPVPEPTAAFEPHSPLRDEEPPSDAGDDALDWDAANEPFAEETGVEGTKHPTVPRTPDPQPTEAFSPLDAADATGDRLPEEPDGEEPRVRRVSPQPAHARAAASAPAAPPRRIPPLPDQVARFGDENERPSGIRRVQGSPRGPQTAPPRHTPPQQPTSGKGHGRRRLAGLVILLLLVGVALYAANAIFQPFAGDGGEPVTVRIPQNSTATQIGDLLERQGVVDSSLVFNLRARISGDRANLKAGTYRLREDMSYAAALDQLTEGPPPPRTINVTVPEGPSRREAAPLIDEAGLRGTYLKASERAANFDPRDYGAPRRGNLEGFLFPATFELKPRATADDLVDKQVDAFKENIRKVDFGPAERRDLSRYEVLVIASMVEREARLAKERRLVAAVIHNRLREGMPLSIDATIRYGVKNWSSPLKVSELQADSPYNTRTRTGLPPTPIGNPGLASIRAAANPANVDYLYYVVRPCGKGAHNFSASDVEFERDRQAYERKRKQLGGKSPTNC